MLSADCKPSRAFQLAFPAMIGPMVGLSHVALRELCRSYLPSGLDLITFTEMLSSLRLPSERLGRPEELRIANEHGLLVPQLLANDPFYIEKSIERLLPWQPWGFDINMGCPVKKTLRHNWGVRLMGDAKYAAQVVSSARSVCEHRLSVKLRCGIEQADVDYLSEFTDHIEQAGADWISVHARAKSSKHKGQARWDVVAQLKARRSIPVVVNGDIQTSQDALKLIQEFGFEAVMFGRALTARPWVFWQLAEDLGFEGAPLGFEGQKAPRTPEEEGRMYVDALKRFLDLLDQYFTNEHKKQKAFKLYLVYGHRWLFYGNALYRRCMKCRSFEELRVMLASDYASEKLAGFTMSPRISL